MGVELRPTEPSALRAFIARARDIYVNQLIDFARVDPADARAKADTDLERLFPAGRPAENVHTFTVVDADGDAAVGIVFFASIERGDDTVAFVYAIEIDDAARGRGFGRAAMLAVEEKARQLGHSEVRLHVFGGNEAARALYRSLGYADVEVTMAKPLA